IRWVGGRDRPAVVDVELTAFVGRSALPPPASARLFALGAVRLHVDLQTHEPIWISYQAVAALLDGRPSDRRMMATRFQGFADIEMGRALGRVLAHEVGNVILGAPFHRPAGLMRARFSADAPAALRSKTIVHIGVGTPSPPGGKTSLIVTTVPLMVPVTAPDLNLWHDAHDPSAASSGLMSAVPEKPLPFCVIVHASVSCPCTSDPLPVHRPFRLSDVGAAGAGGAAADVEGAGAVGVDPHAAATKAADGKAKTGHIFCTTAAV